MMNAWNPTCFRIWRSWYLIFLHFLKLNIISNEILDMDLPTHLKLQPCSSQNYNNVDCAESMLDLYYRDLGS